jgi:hypothetical protein
MDSAEIEGRMDEAKVDIQNESLPQNAPAASLSALFRSVWLDEILAIDEQLARDTWQPHIIQEITDPQLLHLLLAYVALEIDGTEMTLDVRDSYNNAHYINRYRSLVDVEDGSPPREVFENKQLVCTLYTMFEQFRLEWNGLEYIAWAPHLSDLYGCMRGSFRNMQASTRLLREDSQNLVWCLFLIVFTAHLTPLMPVKFVFETLAYAIRTEEEARGLLARFFCRLLPVYRANLRQVSKQNLFMPLGSVLE